MSARSNGATAPGVDPALSGSAARQHSAAGHRLAGFIVPLRAGQAYVPSGLTPVLP